MEHILIKEYVDVIIERHPLYKSLNEKILEDGKYSNEVERFTIEEIMEMI